MHIIKQWGVIVGERLFTPESEWPQYLIGFVSGKSVMEEIESVSQEDGFKLVKAGGKEYKVYKKEVDPKYEAAWPGAYKELKGK